MKQRIGFVIADPNEIHEIKEFNFINKCSQGSFEVEEYFYNQISIFVIYSGIGLVNASIATQHLIDVYKVNQIWNYGAVGSSNKFNLFDVVIPLRFYYYDVKTPWYPDGQTPGEKEYFLNSLVGDFEYVANIGSGQSFLDSLDKINEIQKSLPLDIFDMESTAIAQTCSRNKVNFYCVKAVSDVIGKNCAKDVDEINSNIKKSSKFALSCIIKLINL